MTIGVGDIRRAVDEPNFAQKDIEALYEGKDKSPGAVLKSAVEHLQALIKNDSVQGELKNNLNGLHKFISALLGMLPDQSKAEKRRAEKPKQPERERKGRSKKTSKNENAKSEGFIGVFWKLIQMAGLFNSAELIVNVFSPATYKKEAVQILQDRLTLLIEGILNNQPVELEAGQAESKKKEKTAYTKCLKTIVIMLNDLPGILPQLVSDFGEDVKAKPAFIIDKFQKKIWHVLNPEKPENKYVNVGLEAREKSRRLLSGAIFTGGVTVAALVVSIVFLTLSLFLPMIVMLSIAGASLFISAVACVATVALGISARVEKNNGRPVEDKKVVPVDGKNPYENLQMQEGKEKPKPGNEKRDGKVVDGSKNESKPAGVPGVGEKKKPVARVLFKDSNSDSSSSEEEEDDLHSGDNPNPNKK